MKGKLNSYFIYMDKYNQSNKPYPIGINGKQCIGPCYKPGTYIVHPITLDYVTSRNVPFCPVPDYEYVDPETGQKSIRRIEQCYVPTESSDQSSREIEMNILLPNMDFSCERFLKIYYDIYSFESTLKWLNNNQNVPYNTKNRIMECSWNVFGNKLDYIDDQLIDFYIFTIKKYWIKSIYKKIYDLIYVNANTNTVYLNKNNQNAEQFHIEKINFFIENYVNKNNMYQFLQSYIDINRDEWVKIKNHQNNLKKYFIKFFTKLITKNLTS